MTWKAACSQHIPQCNRRLPADCHEKRLGGSLAKGMRKAIAHHAPDSFVVRRVGQRRAVVATPMADHAEGRQDAEDHDGAAPDRLFLKTFIGWIHIMGTLCRNLTAAHTDQIFLGKLLRLIEFARDVTTRLLKDAIDSAIKPE